MPQALGRQAEREFCDELNIKQKHAGVSLAENIAKFCMCQISL